MSSSIHSTAIVDPKAEIASGVEIGAYAVIGAQVVIHENVRIDSHTVLYGPTEIGSGTKIGAHCVLGGDPQDLSYLDQETFLKIGTDNVIREHCTIHRGSPKEGLTKIGDKNFIMASSHIGHDCHVGDQNIVASFSGFSGHVRVGNHCVISGQTGMAQFTRLGDYVFTSGATRVRKDIPSFMTVRELGKVIGPNLVGLKRAGFSHDEIRVIKECYKLIYKSDHSRATVLAKIESLAESHSVAKKIIEFFKNSKVGVESR